MDQSDEKLVFESKILDNVHGFIFFTKAEREIMDTQLFKRLQSIKQLSVANWVFPGSEHTRFIHSLGVMHIADRIAIQLHCSPKERKIIRMAGLLHDIGHYPLSHVCELPYKKDLIPFPSEQYCRKVNESVKHRIDTFEIKTEQEFMTYSHNGHHEDVGARIIKNNPQIRDIVKQECGEDAIEIICDMIVGRVTRQTTDPLFVQILHSELDADGIDYLLRDATFSGTSFGSFELDQLISCFTVAEYKGKKILCISPKGIAAADQYLINKFFSYSQVVFNKHISNREWMAEQIVDWMKNESTYFPSKDELLNIWVNKQGNFSEFLSFTDNFFWSALKNALDNPLGSCLPPFIRIFCDKLLHHDELQYIEGSEVRVVSRDSDMIKKQFIDSGVLDELEAWTDRFALLDIRPLTKQVPEEQFIRAFKERLATAKEGEKEHDETADNDYQNDIMCRRLMEGICVYDNDNLHLLCDDHRSLMQQLYNTQLVVFRVFEFPAKL